MKYIGLEDHKYKASNQVNDYRWIRKGEPCNPPAWLVDHLLNIEVIERDGIKKENKIVQPEEFKVIKKSGGWVDVLDSNGKEIDSGRGQEDYERLKEQYAK